MRNVVECEGRERARESEPERACEGVRQRTSGGCSRVQGIGCVVYVVVSVETVRVPAIAHEGKSGSVGDRASWEVRVYSQRQKS